VSRGGSVCFVVSVSKNVFLVERLFLLCVSVSIDGFFVDRLFLNCCVHEQRCISGRKAVFAFMCL